MSLADNFSIVVHANNVTTNDGFSAYVLEYTNIAGRVSLAKDEEDVENLKKKGSAVSRIDLKSTFSKNKYVKTSGDTNGSTGGASYVQTNLTVKENLEELQELIDDAQIKHIQKLQKLRIAVL